jgi:hypothetical protein
MTYFVPQTNSASKRRNNNMPASELRRIRFPVAMEKLDIPMEGEVAKKSTPAIAIEQSRISL